MKIIQSPMWSCGEAEQDTAHILQTCKTIRHWEKRYGHYQQHKSKCNGKRNEETRICFDQCKIIACFIVTLFAQLNVRVGILITRGRHLHACIISLRGEVWANKTSLTPPHFIEVAGPSQERERSCICVLGVSTVWYCFVMYLCVRGIDSVALLCHVFVC